MTNLAPSALLALSSATSVRSCGICYAFIVDHLHASEILMASAPKPHPSKPKSSRFVLRPYRRVPTQRVLYYLSGRCVGKGVVTNLSQSGMRVRGEHEVEPGLDLALRLTLSDDGPTIDIDRATVRWVDGNDFGLDFVHLSPSAKKYISAALNQQIRAPQSPA